MAVELSRFFIGKREHTARPAGTRPKYHQKIFFISQADLADIADFI
jgi:hypothetical protein